MNETVYAELQEKFICVHSREELVTGGDILVIPSFSLHGVEVDPLVPYERIVFNVRDDLLVHSYLTEILVWLNRMVLEKEQRKSDNILPPLVAEACKYVEEHLHEKIMVSELSKELHHNKDYVNRCFKKEMGTSLKEYILSRKLVRAQNLLSLGWRPSEVCEQVGFRNYSNFSRMFVKYIGQSPREFQKTNGKI